MQAANSCSHVGKFQYVLDKEIIFNTYLQVRHDVSHASSWPIGESIREHISRGWSSVFIQVNLDTSLGTCRLFDLDHIPCA